MLGFGSSSCARVTYSSNQRWMAVARNLEAPVKDDMEVGRGPRVLFSVGAS